MPAAIFSYNPFLITGLYDWDWLVMDYVGDALETAQPTWTVMRPLPIAVTRTKQWNKAVPWVDGALPFVGIFTEITEQYRPATISTFEEAFGVLNIAVFMRLTNETELQRQVSGFKRTLRQFIQSFRGGISGTLLGDPSFISQVSFEPETQPGYEIDFFYDTNRAEVWYQAMVFKINMQAFLYKTGE